MAKTRTDRCYGASPMAKLNTNSRMRRQALRLIHEFGVSQQFLGEKMGMSPSTFSRWLRDESKDTHTAAIDGLQEFLRRFAAFGLEESQRSEASNIGASDAAGRLQRSGTPR